MTAMYARFFVAAFRPSAAARTPARAFFSFSAARLFKSRDTGRAGSVSFVLAIVLCHNPLGKVQKKARFGFHSLDLWLGQVTFPQRSHSFTFLFQFPARNGSERAGNYDLIGLPVVHDGLVRLQAPRHCHVQCVSRVLLHSSRPEPRATGVTRLGPDGVFLYFDLALSSHCGFFRASVFLERSLLEHSETCALERRCAGCPLCAGGPPVDFLSIRTLSRVCTHQKGLLLATVRFRCAV